MSPQDCNNCYYPAPGEKPEDVAKKVPEGEECPQCFYQPEVSAEPVEECPQCFYQPEGETQPAKEGDDCSQCFYKP